MHGGHWPADDPGHRLAGVNARNRLLGWVAWVWLPVAAGLTVLAATVYAVAQQSIRLAADDVPAQMAEDAAAALDVGASPAQVAGGTAVEISRSAAPVLLVFDQDRRLLASSAVLHGRPPSYPPGVLDTVGRTAGEDRVTWQPEPGVRLATVAVPWHGGAVVGGASLKAPEQRTSLLVLIVAAGWAASLGASLVAAAMGGWLAPRLLPRFAPIERPA